MARTFLVTLHYDGGGFAGWQRQVKERTVQREVERALPRLWAQPVRVHAAGAQPVPDPERHLDGATGRQRPALRDCRRPVPPPHGQNAGGHDGRYRPGATPVERHAPTAGTGSRGSHQPSRPSRGALLRGRGVPARMLRLSPAVRAACAALLLAASCRSSQNGIIPPAGAQRAAENAALSTGRRTAVVDAASRVAPAVVSITVASHRRVAERGPWDFFFF